MSAQANWDSEQYNDPVEIIKKLKQKCTKLKDKTVGVKLLESVFGGVLFTQCGDTPLLMTGSNILNIMQESESESEKATVLGGIVIIVFL